LVTTICFGVVDGRKAVHDLVHVGATQEKIFMWKGLSRLRQDTRRCQMGDAATKWNDFFQGLADIEYNVIPGSGLSAVDFRTQLMERRLGSLQDVPTRRPIESARSGASARETDCTTMIFVAARLERGPSPSSAHQNQCCSKSWPT